MDIDTAVVPHVANPVTHTGAEPVLQEGLTRTYSRNVVVVGFSLAVSAISGIILPSFLARHLSTSIYSGWLLILQISGYVACLDFGIQTAIAKYIAQYTAALDRASVDEHASAGTAITVVSAVIGLVLTGILALLIPTLFRTMPATIAADVTKGVLLVGASTAFLLSCSSFAAFFRGLQRYKVPTFLMIANKLLYVAALILLVSKHCSLTMMGLSVAVINVLTGIAQVMAWRWMLPELHVRMALVVRAVVKQMLKYCAVLGLWTSGMLIITGLDLTIVGCFDFGATAYYAIAATPITFIILLLQAALNPLLPAVSALSVARSAEVMGSILAQLTRYITLLLIAAGAPLFLFGFLMLSLWVGPNYAQRSLAPMRLLILAQIVRNLCGPYATMIIATGRQRAATMSGLCEAAANLVFSIVLGKLYGAIGVASGTLIGAVIGVLVHFFISMRRTQDTFLISPFRLLEQSVLLPAAATLPTLLLLPLFWRARPVPWTWEIAAVWSIVSLAVAWYVALNAEDRLKLQEAISRQWSSTKRWRHVA